MWKRDLLLHDDNCFMLAYISSIFTAAKLYCVTILGVLMMCYQCLYTAVT